MSYTSSLHPCIRQSTMRSSVFYPQVSYRRIAQRQTGRPFAFSAYLNSVVFYARLLSSLLPLNFVFVLLLGSLA